MRISPSSAASASRASARQDVAFCSGSSGPHIRASSSTGPQIATHAAATPRAPASLQKARSSAGKLPKSLGSYLSGRNLRGND